MDWTFDEYVSHVNLHALRQDEQRLGQYAFNLLCRIRPDLSEQVRGSIRDPFYRDEKLPEFYTWVERNW